MKRSNSYALIAIVMGVAMLIWGMMGEAGLKIFWDLPSVIITIGGSFCALMIKYSLVEMKNLRKIFFESIKIDTVNKKNIIIQFLEISKKARVGGVLSLENEISTLDDDFMKKGLQMVIDGIESEFIREILELEIDERERRCINEANIFKTWGIYAPAFGLVGTLIGVIEMLSNLTSPENIASGVGKALIATLYGAILANLIFNPIAGKLIIKSNEEAKIKEIMVEGILAIKSGINPTILEEKLITYLSQNERFEYLTAKVNLNEGVSENG